MKAARGLLLVAALATPLAAGAQAQPRKVRVAILEIRALATETAKAELLSEVALTEAASMPGFDVIGKSDINAIIGFEKQKQVMGCGDDSTCLAEIGGALGVDFIMVGSLGTLGDLFRLDLKLVESKRAKVRSRIGVTVEGKESKLVAAIQKAVRDLLGPETPKEQPVAKAEPAKAPAAAAAKAPEPKKAEPAAAKAPAAVESSRAPASGVSTTASSSRRTWAYVNGGAGLALLAGGAVMGLQAKSAFDKEKKATTAADYDKYKKDAGSLSKTADVLFVTGAVATGIGTYLFFTSRPGAVALELAPMPGGAYAAISGGF